MVNGKAEFDQRICDTVHAEQERRISEVIADQSALESKVDGQFVRMYDKIEKETLVYANQAIEMAKRPGWATVSVISFLSALSVGLLVRTFAH